MTQPTPSSGLPKTQTDDDVVDTYHGEAIADPYRWLEPEDDADQKAWTNGRDEWCRSQLAGVAGREAIAARILELAQIGRVGSPSLHGGKLFFQQRTGTQDQPVLVVRDTIGGEHRVLLDPNGWTEDNTIALDWWAPSGDGSMLAYGTSEGGTEVSTLKVLAVDVPANADLTDAAKAIAIPRCRAANVDWLSDHSGFYYTRYPREGEVPEEDLPYFRHVYFHAMGDAPDGSADRCIFGPQLEKTQWSHTSLSPDDRWLVVTAVDGWSRSDCYLVDTQNLDADAVEIVKGRTALFMAEALEDGIWIHTNEDAPRYKVMRAEFAAPGHDAWTEVVPEGAGTIEGVAFAKDRMVLRELRDATHRVRILTRDGAEERELALPTLGTVAGLAVEHSGTDLVFDFQSFTIPPALYQADLSGGADPAFLYTVADGAPDPALFAVEQVRYASKDGTEIPMFVAHRADTPLDGTAKTLLYGYGGFNVSLTPSFSSSILAWVERGGTFALANLRGGGEFGESWHRDGMLDKKQNTFDDFAAAGDWLVGQGWAQRDKLAVQGGSNGGLLAFATAVQRPDLCRAVISQVPLADMLRFHLFQIARLWIPEYGCSDDAEQYKWLRSWSPYQNVVEGTAYPSVLVMTGESDTRVDPLHARKMAARLEAATSRGDTHPILLRVERKAGHGQGMPLSKAVEGIVDFHCFLEWQLGG